MSRTVRVALGLVACVVCAPGAVGEDPPAKPKIEYRWLENAPVKGVTEDTGILASEDPKNLVYPHKKPALVLTAADVSETRLTKHKLGGGENFTHFLVEIHLKKAALEKLAATVEGKETRWLTITVDGHHWGVHRYEKDKDKKFASDRSRAESFVGTVGFFNSETEAKRVADAFTK